MSNFSYVEIDNLLKGWEKKAINEINGYSYYGKIQGIEYGIYISSNGLVTAIPPRRSREYPSFNSMQFGSIEVFKILIDSLSLSIQLSLQG